MTSSDDHDTQHADRRGSIVHDLYIDFLGSLVPGLFTIVLATAVLALSGRALCESLCAVALPQVAMQAAAQGSGIVSDLQSIGLGPYGTAVVVLVLAYVLGSVFYRQDPKIPDHRSARWIWRNTLSKEDRARLAVQPTSETAEDVTPYDAQFPYFFLHEYLRGRGLDHLARWVPWTGEDRDTWKYRTKMYINILKVRLQFLVPEKCKDIVRNEAHVRLATSLWHATKWLLMACAIGSLMAVFAIVWSMRLRPAASYIPVLAFDALILGVALLLKARIERFIHYLRVREIVYVLETAYFAELNGIDLHHGDLLHAGS